MTPPPAPQSKPEPPEHLLARGDLLGGRYAIEEPLGEGGFAQVYQARDLEIDRPVAIKVLALSGMGRERMKRSDAVERFRREAQAAGMISHPNVVTIFDVGSTEGGEPYIVMECLSGHDLNTELRRNGSMKPSRAIKLFCDCLDALGRAHALGIVHKDLKPENLFLTSPGFPEERLKIFDFGIAHIQREDIARLTVEGHMMGTPHYLAPEYIVEGQVTPALDVYQMGLILVELLTGYPVVADENPLNCVMIHGNGDLDIPEFIRVSRYGGVIDKALSLLPEDRFPNAIAFRNALEEAFDSPAHAPDAVPPHEAEPTPAPAPEAPEAEPADHRRPNTAPLTQPLASSPPSPSPGRSWWPAAALLGVVLLAAPLIWWAISSSAADPGGEPIAAPGQQPVAAPSEPAEIELAAPPGPPTEVPAQPALAPAPIPATASPAAANTAADRPPKAAAPTKSAARPKTGARAGARARRSKAAATTTPQPARRRNRRRAAAPAAPTPPPSGGGLEILD